MGAKRGGGRGGLCRKLQRFMSGRCGLKHTFVLIFLWIFCLEMIVCSCNSGRALLRCYILMLHAGQQAKKIQNKQYSKETQTLVVT